MKTSLIYPKEWLSFHPYTQVGVVDHYYTQLANQIYSRLSTSVLASSLRSDNDIRTIACCLTAYFEDIISQTGIWKAFTTECCTLYGKPLPFYKIDQEMYAPDEINVDDVRFLLWHYAQGCNPTQIVNPENPGFLIVAHEVYELLDQVYETAPENPKMQKLFTSTYNNFFDYRNVVEWFTYHCYLNIINRTELEEKQSEIFRKTKKEHLDVMLKTTLIDFCFTSLNGLLALTSVEWLSRIFGKNHPQHAVFDDMKRREYSFLLFLREDKHFLYMEDLCYNDQLRIDKKSVQKIVKLIPNDSLFSCALVRFNNEWWQCGMLIPSRMSDLTEGAIKNLTGRYHKPDKTIDYQTFEKVSKGEQPMYFSSKKQLIEFLTQTMKYTLGTSFHLPSYLKEKSALVATSKKGLQIINQGIECIKDPRNPFYDPTIAKEITISFYGVPNFCPYEALYYLHENKMLPDACYNSLKGEERGRSLFIDNADFFMRYYLGRFPEKDL